MSENEESLHNLSDEKKWELVKGDIQHSKSQEQQPVEWYVDQLKRHLDPELKAKKPNKAKFKGLESSHEVLRKLEVALRTNAAQFAEEFVDHPNMGMFICIHMLVCCMHVREHVRDCIFIIHSHCISRSCLDNEVSARSARY